MSAALDGFLIYARNEWLSLVDLALATPEEHVQGLVMALANKANIGVDSLKRKFGAIKHQASLGFTADEIIRMGQEKVLGGFIKARKVANYQGQVVMKWNVPGSQRELMQQQEQRIRRILGLATSVDFFDWLLGQLTTLTDEEILSSAGEDQEG